MNLAALLWAGLLAYSAATKVRGMPHSMLRAMRDLALPAPLMRPAVAYAHLAAQILVALGLTLAQHPFQGVCAAGGVLLALAYLAVIWRARGRSCQCFGTTARPITSWTLVRSILVVALACWAAAWGSVAQWPTIPLFLSILAIELASAVRTGRA